MFDENTTGTVGSVPVLDSIPASPHQHVAGRIPLDHRLSAAAFVAPNQQLPKTLHRRPLPLGVRLKAEHPSDCRGAQCSPEIDGTNPSRRPNRPDKTNSSPAETINLFIFNVVPTCPDLKADCRLLTAMKTKPFPETDTSVARTFVSVSGPTGIRAGVHPKKRSHSRKRTLGKSGSRGRPRTSNAAADSG